MAAFPVFLDGLASALLSASIGGAIAAAVVAVLCRLLPTLSPRVKTTLWWLVAARFLMAFVWTSPIALPLLPAATPAWHILDVSGGRGLVADASAPAASPWTLANTALILWAAGVLVAAALAARQWRHATRIVQRSEAASPTLVALVAELAATLGVRRTPAIRTSSQVRTPLVIGVVRPTIIVPATSFAELSVAEQRMALCHELAHVRRRDLVAGLVPAIAERLFFFHPLAHAVSREYALWREAACDAAVLEALDAAPDAYGQLLLDLGVSRSRAGLTTAGASLSFSTLKRRLLVLHQDPARSRSSRAVATVVVAGAVLMLIPMTLVARRAAADAPAPQTVATAAASPQAMKVPADAEIVLRKQQIEAEAAETRKVRQDREQVAAVMERQPELRFVLFKGGDETILSGPINDVTHASRLRANNERLLWFTISDAEYLVTDADSIAAVQKLWDTPTVYAMKVAQPGTDERRIEERAAEVRQKQREIEQASKERQLTAAELEGRTQELAAIRETLAALATLRGDSTPREVGPDNPVIRERVIAGDKQMMEVSMVNRDNARRQSEALLRRYVETGKASRIK